MTFSGATAPLKVVRVQMVLGEIKTQVHLQPTQKAEARVVCFRVQSSSSPSGAGVCLFIYLINLYLTG